MHDTGPHLTVSPPDSFYFLVASRSQPLEPLGFMLNLTPQSSSSDAKIQRMHESLK